jgi:Methyltransferase domain
VPASSPEPEGLLSSLSFRPVEPDQGRDPAQRIVVDRPGREPATLLELFGAPFDAVNTIMPAELKQRLRPLLDIPRMSTLAVAGVLNRAVATMPAGQSFVNVGVWQGFTFMSALAGNPGVRCVGVDDFSEFNAPRDALLERFERARGPAHRFFEMDYREYFARVHEGPIGVYLYDGEHSYDNQLRGLEAAEPFLTQDCLLIVDDTNRAEPRQATLDFVARRATEYRVVADVWTGASSHPTFWNGLLVIRRGGGAVSEMVVPRADEQAVAPAPPGDGRSPMVTLVVLDAGALEPAHAQTWPNLEVLTVDDGLAEALARSSGSLVAFVDGSAELRDDAVELSVAYPDVTPFWRPVDESRVARAHRGIRVAAKVDAVIPAGSEYVLVADALGMPHTCAAGPGAPLAAGQVELHELGDEAARDAMARARARGATYLVVMWSRFAWLDDRPGLAGYLDAEADVALENRHVRVFRFRAPGR